jgi:XTP/dITP diphosphohydrolase
LPAIADDSGLLVDALGGAPGLYSARYAGPAADGAANIAKLLSALHDVPIHARSARFVCVAVYLRAADDPLPVIAQGIWDGEILTAVTGTGGFGYDPIFRAKGHALSAAQMAAADKDACSHRGLALAQLKRELRRRVGG